MANTEFAAWLNSGDAPEFIDLVRHNVLLPGDAVAWRAVVNGELAPLGDDEKRVIEAAGGGFFAAAVEAFDQSGADLKSLAKTLKERTGRKGPEVFMPLRVALTGQAHGPELAQAAQTDGAANVARRRLEIYVLKIHNSLTGLKQEFKPLVEGEVRMYVCGMTTYDYIHVGHAAHAGHPC